jgi:hypothetical protein
LTQVIESGMQMSRDRPDFLISVDQAGMMRQKTRCVAPGTKTSSAKGVQVLATLSRQLASSGCAQSVEPSYPIAPYREPVVLVSVSGGHLALPSLVLSAGLSDLRLATEASVGMEDYARGVGLVLEALAKRSMLGTLALQLTHHAKNQANP